MADFDFTLPDEPETSAPAAEQPNTEITDHADRAVDRLAEQYRKPKLEAFLRCLIGPAQAIEAAYWQMFVQRNVNTAIGAQLDIIGRVVGQERAGLDDDAYRRLIRARIAVNRSSGRTNEVLNVAELVIFDVGVAVELEAQYPAGIVVRAVGTVPSDVAELVISFLRDTVAAGVRVIFEYATVAPAAAFSFAGGPGLGFGDGAFASAKD